MPPDHDPREPRRAFLRKTIQASGAVMALVATVPCAALLLNPLFARVRKARRKLLFASPTDAASPRFVPARYEGQSETEPGLFARRAADGKPVVLSAKCTHAGCAVQWQSERNRFFCPCHNAVFDEDGRPVSGPAPKPLEALPAQVANGEVYLEVPEA